METVFLIAIIIAVIAFIDGLIKGSMVAYSILALIIMIILVWILYRVEEQKREAAREREDQEKARLRALEEKRRHEAAAKELTRKYQYSPIIDEIISVFGHELGGMTPQRIIVARDYVQASWESKTSTYYFLSHGLDPLPEKCTAKDDPFHTEYYPVMIFAKGINERMGNQYHIENENYSMRTERGITGPNVSLPSRQVKDGLHEVILRINATRHF